jgi:hypothetical protein
LRFGIDLIDFEDIVAEVDALQIGKRHSIHRLPYHATRRPDLMREREGRGCDGGKVVGERMRVEK